MSQEIVSAKETIHDLRAMVNRTWEKWLPIASKKDPDFTSIDDAFDNAIDKITDAYENLLDLVATPGDVAPIVQTAAADVATVLQRVVSWHLKDVERLFRRWQFRLFLPTQDIFEEHQQLSDSFTQAIDLHEKNRFAEAAQQYHDIADRAIKLRTKIRLRPTLHPSRRQFLLNILAIILGLIAISLALYFNLWRAK